MLSINKAQSGLKEIILPRYPSRLYAPGFHSVLDLSCKMKFDLRVILNLFIQEPLALRQIDPIPVFVLHDVGLLEADKGFDLLPGPGNPAGLIEVQGSQGTGSAV